jgi:hypothetical protein
MKYVFYGLIVLIIVGIIMYIYFNRKFLAYQEKSFEDLQNAEFIESPRTFKDTLKLTEENFWCIIEESKSNSPKDFNSQMEYLTRKLSKLSNEEIIGFEKRLREKMIELWNYNVKSLYQIILGNYFSTDGFIYFRLWIISNGKDFFYKSINDTDNLSEKISKSYDGDGEALLIVADNAFKIKNGNEKIEKLPRDLSLEVDYDFGKYKMTGIYISPSAFKKHFPKLTKKF